MRSAASVLAGLMAISLLQAWGTAAANEASTDDLKQANNPLADFRAFNIHNYWIPEVAGTDETANTM